MEQNLITREPHFGRGVKIFWTLKAPLEMRKKENNLWGNDKKWIFVLERPKNQTQYKNQIKRENKN